jgi:hypothetical protein
MADTFPCQVVAEFARIPATSQRNSGEFRYEAASGNWQLYLHGAFSSKAA